jgi:hypothetical protein
MLSDAEDELIAPALAILGEHFPHYAVIVLSEGDDLHYDYSNYRIGRMLMRDSLEDMESEANFDMEDGIWTDISEWDDEDED